MSLQPNFEVLWIEQVLKKPSKTNASKHSIHFPPFQGHKKSIRNSLFSNSLSKMLHFFSMKFATTLDFTGFPVISHLFTDGLTLECPFVRYSVKLHLERKNPAQVICSHMATISTSAAITTRCLTSPKSVMPVISSLSMKI